jgi:hypothetical protein
MPFGRERSNHEHASHGAFHFMQHGVELSAGYPEVSGAFRQSNAGIKFRLHLISLVKRLCREFATTDSIDILDQGTQQIHTLKQVL